ncbi:hypothetical protein U1Q18_023194 [Sarracenia purpurea var. burkii]
MMVFTGSYKEDADCCRAEKLIGHTLEDEGLAIQGVVSVDEDCTLKDESLVDEGSGEDMEEELAGYILEEEYLIHKVAWDENELTGG